MTVSFLEFKKKLGRNFTSCPKWFKVKIVIECNKEEQIMHKSIKFHKWAMPENIFNICLQNVKVKM